MGRTKICTKCGKELPATKKFFHKQKEGKFGVRSHCKECIRDDYMDKRPKFDKNAQVFKRYIENVDYVVCQVCGAKLKGINHRHLRTHNLTPSEYQKLYPKAITILESSRRKISETSRNRTPSEETRKKLSKSKTGENHPLFGRKFSKEHRKKISEALSGEKHPMFGKKHSEESKRKNRESNTGKNHPNFGKSRSKNTKRKISEALKEGFQTGSLTPLSGVNHPLFGKQHTIETKRKMSASRTANDELVNHAQNLELNMIANIYFFFEEESVWTLYSSSPLEEGYLT